jgi:hypothetical protein
MDINQVIKSSHTAPAQETAAALYGGNSADAAQNPAPNDSLKLSQEGVFLNELSQGNLEWGKTFKTVPPIPHTAQELSTWFNDYKEAVRKNIEELFQQNDIQLQQPVTLQTSDDGGVQVDGNHPQAQEIQQAIDGSALVNNQIQSLSQRSDLFSILGHGNDLRQASNDSERSQAAEALSEHLNNPPPFRLTVNPSSSVEPASNQA